MAIKFQNGFSMSTVLQRKQQSAPPPPPEVFWKMLLFKIANESVLQNESV